MELSSTSISEMTMFGNIFGKGEIRAKLLKHLAPVTLTRIQLAVPFTGRLNFFEKSFVYIISPLIAGEEKAKYEFEKGEVAFLPGGSMLCFFIQKVKIHKAMNPLGKLEQGLEILEKSQRGDSLRIQKIVSGT